MFTEKENLDYFQFLLREEAKISNKTRKQFEKEFEFYERSVNLLYDLFNDLSQLTKFKPYESGAQNAILIMVPRLLGTMQSIRVLTLKGYYADVAVLIRSIEEHLGLCTYLATNEEKADEWLKGKKIEISKSKLSSHIQIFLANKVYGDVKARYRTQSAFVHATSMAMKGFIVDIDHAKNRILLQVAPSFIKEAVPYLGQYPTVLLCILFGVFKNELDERWKEKILNFSKEYLAETKRPLKSGSN